MNEVKPPREVASRGFTDFCPNAVKMGREGKRNESLNLSHSEQGNDSPLPDLDEFYLEY